MQPIPLQAMVPAGAGPGVAMERCVGEPALPVDATLDIVDGSRAIEVVVLFGETVLQVRQLKPGARGAAFVLGSGPDVDLPLAHPSLPGSRLALVSVEGGERALSFTSAMEGEVWSAEERLSLADLVQCGRARAQAPDTYRCALPPDARARIVLGEVQVLVRSVLPARGFVRTPLVELDRPTKIALSGSLLAHAVLLFLVVAVIPGEPGLSLDYFDVRYRFVEVNSRLRLRYGSEWGRDLTGSGIGVRAPVPVREPGREGGARLGTEGQMGSPQAPRRFRARSGGGAAGGRSARSLGVDAARAMGRLAAAAGGGLAAALAPGSAFGPDAEQALGGWVGSDVGEAYGVGGLGLVGFGAGAGGTSRQGIGLGRLETVGGGGGGANGYGRGVGRLSCRGEGSGGCGGGDVGVVAGRATVIGSLDKELIRKAIRRHMNEIRYCYERELEASPDLYGRVVVSFVIDAGGRVPQARIAESTLENADVESCVVQAFRRWRFPACGCGGINIVRYPLVFKSTR